MNKEARPDPDVLLARVEAEERQKSRGRLKIFLGYAAGVGKTYAMLEAARSRKEEGVDVVLALVETHGRAETEALLQGLEVIPRRMVEYRGVTLSEMDLDAVLARKPQLALVDELAHTNAPGSRHAKRWQDVEELLNAGIDVYTTLNIQHLESFRDIVAQTTGITIRETLPDRLLDEAAEIEVVDLPPEELLQRLREGKVYVPEQAARAIEGFFEKGNLIALREMTLRRAATRVDEQMRKYLEIYSTPGLLPPVERLLVCISGGPNSERLVRTARRLAEELKTEWYALYVETGGEDQLTQQNRERIWRELRLAESLGAKEVTTVKADCAVDAVLDYVRRRKLNKIIVGRPTRAGWRARLRGSFVDQILKGSRGIDVYVVSEDAAKPEKALAPRPARGPVRNYLASVLLITGATMISLLVSEFLAPANMIMFYLLAVVVAALRLGFRPALLAAALGVLAFDFFLVPPYHTFTVHDKQYLITFAGLFIVGAVISTLVARARRQTEALKVREVQTSELLALTRDLASAVTLDDILQAVIRHTSETLNADVALFLPQGEFSLEVRASSSGFVLSEKEKSVALWSFQNGQAAGRGTDTLSSAELWYVPLQTGGRAVGVMALRLKDSGEGPSPEARQLLEAFSRQAAVAIERAHLARKAEEGQLLKATERLERALLNSVSHDLRTPLSSIMGALSTLREEGNTLGDSKGELVDLAWEEAGRMNRFITNLLDLTRLEAGALKIKKEPYDVQDLVGSCLASLEPRLKERRVDIHIPPRLPLVPMDSVLMAQVIVNVLDNALKYSPPQGKIVLAARLGEREMEIEVADEGPGIPEEDLAKIFDKFFHGSGSEETGGTGLGLAISKGIVEAHGGRIRAENRPEGGARIVFTLPLQP